LHAAELRNLRPMSQIYGGGMFGMRGSIGERFSALMLVASLEVRVARAARLPTRVFDDTSSPRRTAGVCAGDSGDVSGCGTILVPAI
jgi:hypothetical protein